jgi:hypothetical protein
VTLLEDHLSTEASPAEVWEVLLDTARWGEWNTLLAEVPEGFETGAPLSLVIRLGGLHIPARARLIAVEPERQLVWKGGVPGLFRARHGFDLAPALDGGTVIRHHETFWGMLHRPLLRALGERQRQVYRRVNEGLAAAALSRRSP